jgi:transposase
MNRTEQFKSQNFQAAEWQKLFYKHQQQYIRKRLEAIKYLHEGQTRQEVMERVGCARQSLITWIDLYCQGGLNALTTPLKSDRKQSLGDEEKAALKKMLLEQKPSDYGIDRQIWTGQNIIEVIEQRWAVKLKDSRIYDILKEIGLSHQKAHRDYENGEPEAQREFVTTLKKNWQTSSPTRG